MSFHKQFQLEFDFYSTFAHPAGRVKKHLAASLTDLSLPASHCHRYATDATHVPTTRHKLPHAEFPVCVAAGIHSTACKRERLVGSRFLEGVRSSLIFHCRGDEHDS